jgi:hypothetical protein
MELELRAMGNNFGSRVVLRALRVLATMGALALIAGLPATAHAKKQHKLQMDPTVPETPEQKGPVPPEADANGHVHFGNPQAEGLGRVTVKSKTGDKLQVYLEGRYFGDAPITIYSVPRGDYIVEGTIVSSGKQVSSPVSVSENEEATVELGPKIGSEEPVASTSASGGGMFSGEISPNRLTLTKVFLGAAAVGVVGAVVFGILENGKENSYEKASSQAQADSIGNTGRTYAMMTNIGIALAGVGLVGAVIAGYPMFHKTTAEKAPDATPTAFVAPMLGNGTTGAAASIRF